MSMIKIKNKVSVIIPCYNDGKYLPEAVESVERCDKNYYEIIIVDDGSKDKKTKEALKLMVKKGHRVFKIKHSGQSSARNFGVKKARHPYLLFLDADNKIFPEYISEGIKILNQNPEIGIVYGNRKEFGLRERVAAQKDFDISKIIFSNYIDACAVIRKKVWQDCQGFDKNMFISEDWEFWINAYKRGWKFSHIPKTMFYYRIRNNSVTAKTRTRNNRLKILNHAYKKHYSLFIDNFERAMEYFNSQNASLNNQIEALNSQIEVLNNQNASLNNQIEASNAYINSIERSLTWNLLNVYQRIIDFLLPKDLFLRIIYDRVIEFNQTLINKKIPPLPATTGVQEIIDSREEFWEKFYKKNGVVDILFVNHEESRTGAPKILFEIAKRFSKKYSIAIVSKKGGSMHKEFNDNFSDIIYPETLHHSIAENEIAKNILEKVFPSLVYVNTIASYEYAEEARKVGVPVVFHIHELKAEFGARLNYRQIRDFPRQADIFIACSKAVYNFLVNEIKCEKEKVVIIKGFINCGEILDKSKEKKISEIYSELDKKRNEIIVLGVGSISIRKGADIFLKSFEILQKTYPDRFKFVWVGKKAEGDNFYIPEKKYQNFLILGEKENPYPYIKAADIFVLPSREDPFPIVVLEAMFLGKPIIAFGESGGAQESLRRCGILVKNTDAPSLAAAIKKLADNNKLIKKLSERAKNNYKRFDSEIILREIEKVIFEFFEKFIYKTNSKIKFNKKISVIIPSYNYGRYISQAIESVINQTYKNWELIIIDDNSDDNSVQVIKQYIKKYPKKIKLIIKNKKEQGLPMSYKIGVKESKTEYIAFLEADDVWEKDNLSKKTKILGKYPDIICVFSDVKMFGPDEDFLKYKGGRINLHFRDIRVPRTPFSIKEYVGYKNLIKTLSSVLIAKKALENIDFSDKYKAWFDWWFYAQLSLRGNFFYLPKRTVLWRIHKESYIESHAKTINEYQQFLKMQKEIREYLVNEEIF